jgi:NAD(P)-dependent dehydrogenase (short-subunit alcohol dehydrogenase family)
MTGTRAAGQRAPAGPPAESSPAALITGSTRGIGRAIASRLAGEGFRVVVHGRADGGRGAALTQQLPGSGHGFVAGDLAEPEAARELFAAATAQVGPLAVLVNNAAIYEEAPFLTDDLDAFRAVWRRTLRVNLDAAAELAYLAANHMRGRGGKIIQIASRAAFRGETEFAPYAVSKAGMVNLSICLARALAKDAVYAYTIAPGWTDTDMGQDALTDPQGVLAQIPFGRMATPEEVAGVVAFLVRSEADYLSGITIDVNGASYFR